ncbi:guanylate kinase [Chloroflexota bacterium]
MSRQNQPYFNHAVRPLLMVLSGLSGAGKDAVLSSLKSSKLPLEYIITLTTRPPRPGEKDKVHYRFISRSEFQQMVDRGELLEWANVYGNFYGVPRQPIQQALAAGRDAIVKVDVQGVATIKEILPQAVFIFLMPPTIEEHLSRLKNRRTESPDEAKKELQQLSLFDYVVFNREGEIDRAAADIRAIIQSEKCRVTPREITL